MKKKLEADLISIAHRVLQMKNKSDINLLWIESQKLYEKLSILRFLEANFEGPKPTIGQADVIDKMDQFYSNNHSVEDKAKKMEEIHLEESFKNKIKAEVAEEEESLFEETIQENNLLEVENSNDIEYNETNSFINVENIILRNNETNEEELTANEDLEFSPNIEIDSALEPELTVNKESKQISFEDLLGINYSETIFVKASSIAEKSSLDFELPKSNPIVENWTEEKPETIKNSTNEKIGIGFNIGLNDKIGFVKYLFGESELDYNRVINQLITFDNFEEAKIFIEDIVKPDYGDWEGKADYEQRFIEIIEKKFV